jgi:hypothetical protein
MPCSTIRVLMELDPDRQPIAGTVQQQPTGPTTTFHGWLQLSQLLEAIRTSSH